MMQDHHVKFLDRRISLAYAIWHLSEVSDNYQTCAKFCDISRDVLEDQQKMMHLDDIDQASKLNYYQIFGYLKIGYVSRAYSCLKDWIISFLIQAGKLKPKKKKEAQENLRENNMNENIITETKKILDNVPEHVWKNFWHMYAVTFLPGMIATKLNVILNLLKRKEDAKNFTEVYSSEDGGILSDMNKRYPIVIAHIKKYLLGYGTHRKFQSVLRQQKSDLKEYIEHGKGFCFLKSPQLLDYESKHEHCQMVKKGTFLEFDLKTEHKAGRGTGLAIPMEQSAESYFQLLFKSSSGARELVKEVYEELGTADAAHSCCGCAD